MKKLMIALASVATAFGLYAADDGFVSGAGFDTTDTEGYTWLKDGGFVSGYWANTEKASIVADEYTYGGEHPAQFAGDKDRAFDQYLKIEATPFGATPVKVSIKQSDDGQRLGDGFYYDSLVNFTACDEDPVFTAEGYADAKIFVYPRQNDSEDEEKGVNYYVAALGADGNAVAYKTSTTFAEGWHRVTVKMIKSVLKGVDTDVGFVVFVDGQALDCMDAQAAFSGTEQANLTPAAKKWFNLGQLFRSLAKTTDEVKGVAYDGKGSVDEIAFTTTAPEFAADAQFFQVGWDNESIESVSVNGTELTSNPQDVEFVAGSTYTFVAKDGFKSVTEGTAFVDLAPGAEYTLKADKIKATVVIDGAAVAEDFTDIDVAIAAINGATSSAILKLGDDVDHDLVFNAAIDLVIDLAGKTIMADTANAIEIGAAATVLITNTTETVGVVDASGVTGGYAVYNSAGTVTLAAGKYIGEISADDYTICQGGLFSKEGNTDAGKCRLTPAEGLVFVEADDTDYWTLAPAQDEPFSGGDGSEENPYLISKYKDLVELQEKVAAGDTFENTYFKQTTDIALEAAWKCIGSSTIPFKGNYDGQNYTISNLRFAVDGDTKDGAYTYLGFFRYVYGGTIENLKIEMAADGDGVVNGFDLTNKGDVTEWGGAAFVGQAMTNAVLRNLTAVSGTIAGSHNVGGIAIKAFPSVQILDCTNFVNLVAGYTKAAGIVVFTQKDTLPAGTEEEMTLTISGCRNVGTITATDWVVLDKDSKPTKWAGKDGLGGIIDYIGGSVIVKIENCSSEGEISVGAQANAVPVGSIGAMIQGAGLVDLGGNTTTQLTIPSAVDHANKAAGITDGSFIYAVENNGVATFVKPALDLTGAIVYKVMAKNVETVTLTAGQTIKFDEAIASVTVAPDDAEKNKVEKTLMAGTVYMYTCAALPVGPVVDPTEGTVVKGDDGKYVITPAAGKSEVTVTDAGDAEFKIEVADDITIKGVAADKITVMCNGENIAGVCVGGDATGFSTALDPAKTTPAFTEGASGEEPLVVGENVGVTVTSVKGLAYTLVRGEEVGTIATNVTTLKGTGEAITLEDANKPAGKAFYKVSVSKAVLN